MTGGLDSGLRRNDGVGVAEWRGAWIPAYAGMTGGRGGGMTGGGAGMTGGRGWRNGGRGCRNGGVGYWLAGHDMR